MLLVVANFMVSEFCVLAAVQVDQVMMFLESSHNTNVIFCSATLFFVFVFFHSLYEWKLLHLYRSEP